MIDTCPKCKKTRAWIGKKDKSNKPMFRRVQKRGETGFCHHVLPLRINVYFPPDGVL